MSDGAYNFTALEPLKGANRIEWSDLPRYRHQRFRRAFTLGRRFRDRRDTVRYGQPFDRTGAGSLSLHVPDRRYLGRRPPHRTARVEKWEWDRNWVCKWK